MAPKQKLPPEAVAAPPPLPDVPRDTSAVAPRAAPQAGLDRFRNDPAYDYERVGAAGPSLWDLFWRWFEETFLDPISENTSQLFWRIFWPSVVALFLGWLVARIVRGGSFGFFARRDGAAPEGALLLGVEDIESVDLDALLSRALDERRHRDAVRLLYLRALQSLVAAGLLSWQKDKTNADYLRELRGARRGSAHALVQPFAEVTRLFEWVWYGEASVDAARFEAVRARFERFGNTLGALRPAAPKARGPA